MQGVKLTRLRQLANFIEFREFDVLDEFDNQPAFI